MKFVVEGTFSAGGKARPFIKELEATSEARAKELTLQKLGADHHIGRTKITIASVERMEDGKH